MFFCLYNKKNITRWLEDMNFIFEWQKQYFTRSLRSFATRKIKFISSFLKPSVDNEASVYLSIYLVSIYLVKCRSE